MSSPVSAHLLLLLLLFGFPVMTSAFGLFRVSSLISWETLALLSGSFPFVFFLSSSLSLLFFFNMSNTNKDDGMKEITKRLWFDH